MNVKEVLAVLTKCDPDQNIYIRDTDGTAQIVTAIGDLRHTNIDLGITIPDDLYMMTTAQFEEYSEEDDE